MSSILVLGGAGYIGSHTVYELIAAGENVVVVGILRGLAHAGAKGNKEAIIAAASIEAPQLRIANIVKEMEIKIPEEYSSNIKTEAYVNEKDEIIVE